MLVGHIGVGQCGQCVVRQVRADADADFIESQLFLRRVTVDSFRRYTLVAENAVGARTRDVRFVRSKLPLDALHATALLSTTRISKQMTKGDLRH